MRPKHGMLAGLLAGATPGGLAAQEPVKPLPAPPAAPAHTPAIRTPPAADVGGKDIVVTAQRPRGSVIGDIPPERTFSPLDIRAYGANDLQELLQTLAPQVSSDRGREDDGPVVLLNGKRVSSLAEIEKIPTEAIERMEIFPEEVALAYGYRADQKVVNVVTFERFSSRVGQLAFSAPTAGGHDMVGATANYLRIRGDTRYNLNAEYAHSSGLLESDRDVRQLDGTMQAGRFRSLLPQTDRFALNGTVSGTVLRGVSATLNGRYEATGNASLLGLGSVGPLTRDAETHIAHLGTTLDGRRGRWVWSLTGNYDRTSTDTRTDVGDAGGSRSAAQSINALGNADLLLSGPVLDLPAGPVSTSVGVEADVRDFRSRSVIGDVERTTALSRDRGAVHANLDVPIASRRKGGLAWLGNFSVNANARVERLSDIGTLRTFGYGLNWSPIGAVSLIAAVTDEQGAPTVEQLGAPLVVTPNVPVFDFMRRETVAVTQIFGGNPTLRADDRHVFGLQANVRPLVKTDFTVSIDYQATRIDHPIASFPLAAPAIEAAFPERYTRDVTGRLTRIDSTPLNFARSDRRQLRWGLNLTKPWGAQPPEAQLGKVVFANSPADLQRTLPPGARVTTIEPGSPAARQYENLSSRLTISAYHTWRLEDEIVPRAGAPVLDLLNGSAVDYRGGRPRHEIDVQGGAFRRGLGARLTAHWQSGTTVRGLATGSTGSAGDLTFANYATFGINLFANPAQYLGGSKAPEWLKATRVSIGIDNLFDTRPAVRDQAGATPLEYQRAYLNPVGRLVSMNLRKIF